MDFGSGFEAEVWLKLTCERLRMVDQNPPSFREIRTVLTRHLDMKVQRAIAHMNDEYDPELWLDYILKIDVLLSLQDLEGNDIKIGIDVTTLKSEVSRKFGEICSRRFQNARRELGIAKHWVLVVSALGLPSDDMLIDKFYEVADTSDECSIIDLSV